MIDEKNVEQLREFAESMGIPLDDDVEQQAFLLAVMAKQAEKEGVGYSDKFIEQEGYKVPNTQDYLAIAPKDTLVAFWDGKGILRSAAIVARNPEKKMVKVETEYGKQYILKYEDIEWVKSGEWWPKEVYDVLVNGLRRKSKSR